MSSPIVVRNELFETFQKWALKNYGDSGKTKTVTRRKHDRIVRVLTGEEHSSAENSKFRFWVKAKGFCQFPVGKITPSNKSCAEDKRKKAGKGLCGNSIKALFVPTKTEIAETYSFLPREAVTRFLMSCTDCQKRMHLSLEGTNSTDSSADHHRWSTIDHVTGDKPCDRAPTMTLADQSQGSVNALSSTLLPLVNHDEPINFSVPITQAILNQLRKMEGCVTSDYSHNDDPKTTVLSPETASCVDSDFSTETGSSTNNNLFLFQESASYVDSDFSTETGSSTNNNLFLPSDAEETKDSTLFQYRSDSTPTSAISSTRHPDMTDNLCSLSTQNVMNSNNSPITHERALSDGKHHIERKRRASDESADSCLTKASESCGTEECSVSKDEDDDDNDDDDEKGLPGYNCDPERLKAFNMFGRLFVDENLDRTVPISKQPKDKVQAILEACDRQFPEYHIRSRKRIRTYLKSCRRMRRSKEQNGWETNQRPTPPHLTSAAAEGLLAVACENESQNAKRMRMGLEPLPASVMNTARELGGIAATLLPNPIANVSAIITSTVSKQQEAVSTPTPHAISMDRPNSIVVGTGAAVTTELLRHQLPSTAFSATPDFQTSFFTSNGNGLYRPASFAPHQHPAHQHPSPSIFPHSPMSGSSLTNGDFVPTDLSMKKGGSKSQLSDMEVTTIKQLIAGYRESAAFLYRSADELEQLLFQQT